MLTYLTRGRNGCSGPDNEQSLRKSQNMVFSNIDIIWMHCFYYFEMQ